MKGNDGNGAWMARGLGLLSLGFGVSALSAPDTLAQAIGFRDESASRSALTAIGLRETVSGLGLLTWPRAAGWRWARVAGDAMDLALLGWSLSLAMDARAKDRRTRLAATTAVTVGIAALDLWSAIRSSIAGAQTERQPGEYDVEAKRAITINRSREEIYQVWRDFRNLPRFMENLESVQIIGENRSHWVAKAPAGGTAEWDAEMVDDQPGERIAWRSLPDSQVENAGSVRFVEAPGNRGTEIHVEVRYNAPAGRLGATVAKIFGKEPGQQIASDLRRFKQVMETGEIARSDTSARGGGPAQPPKKPVPVAEAIHLPGEPAHP